ncbi:molybdate ABC transporter ATP-binding protein [Aurantiacibacter atlanticus]|uniref:Molybdate ABC transporter ATP-binding protein n=1 Tax=Aurantiacibacter atlanticus TaxID=1648404 RepID=A0A0H4VWN5_9SPHN|nr:ATP-binding cassette domain-containing protein [Aurantiacibacter atlanticus]AKQ41483.1 molybdate ABC transporter ATP-binding protein [Aurantiacibacter atlanticus]MDF1833261.1 ATP-binding cassette domain-containing protein [Alteraurantiacibacter sp. bin_em_oilr2.035]
MFFDIDITMRVGERLIETAIASDAKLTAIVGPSGVGKTSVLNAVSGLLQPRSGHIRIECRTLFDSFAGVNVSPEHRCAGYVFQDARLFPHRRVSANLAYGEKLARTNDRWIDRNEIIGLLEIGDLLGRWPATLSGGEVRRVAIARALLAAPRFLLLDEPLVSLDPGRAERLIALIENIRDTLEVPILLVSHSAQEVERLAGHVIELARASGS